MRDTYGLRSLRARILAVFLAVILVVFAAILGAFNFLVDRYLASTAIAQLSTAVAINTPPDQVSGTTNGVPELGTSTPSPFNTRPAVFLMGTDYGVLAVSRTATGTELTTAAVLASLLEQRGLDPSTVSNLRLTTDDGSFYVSCVTLHNQPEPDAYLVFYVDVTGIVNFAGSVNLRLIEIMLAAVPVVVVATWVITQRMTRPLANLTRFAERIGRGDFAPHAERFRDREIATLADSLNQTARQLETYDKDQKTFFQNASHELRTPLMAITCNAEGIACGIMEPAAASQTILTETARLTEMVEDLLTVSRLDSISHELKMVVCDVPAILRAAAEEQRGAAEERGLALTFDLADGVILPGNNKTLHRAFGNLVSNAVRYARTEIKLACHQEADGIVVVVSDDGPGIAEEDLGHIFERFYKGVDGNHGIGLAIVKSVVDQHGGVITVHSDAAGTSFRITFPPPER